MNLLRKFVALLAAIVVLSALIGMGTTAHLWAILVPILIFAGLVVAVLIDLPAENVEAPLFPLLSAIPVRAPPSC